jgi:hypothetical protein
MPVVAYLIVKIEKRTIHRASAERYASDGG